MAGQPPWPQYSPYENTRCLYVPAALPGTAAKPKWFTVCSNHVSVQLCTFGREDDTTAHAALANSTAATNREAASMVSLKCAESLKPPGAALP